MHPRAIPAVLFLLVWASCTWFGSWEFNPNSATRLFAAVGIVERGDAAIDRMAPLTIDKARFGTHYYLDKAPGMTLMALGPIALADALTGDREALHAASVEDQGLARFYRLRLRLAVALGPALLTALAALLLYDIGFTLTGQADAALFGALGYALGSPIWGWTTTLFGHASVGALYVIAVWAGLGMMRRPWLAGVAGFALGWAVVIENQAVLAGLPIGLWLLWRLRGGPWVSRVLALAAGGLLALMPFALYNLIAFGTPFRIGYSGVVGYEGMQRGLFGLGIPRPVILWEITFGVHKGLFWFTPVLVTAVPGLLLLWRNRATRALAATTTASAAIVLLVNAAYFYWDGGNATGPRHAMPAIGLLAIGLAPFFAHLRTRGARIAAIAALALSIALNCIIAAAEILAPPQYLFPIWSAVIQLRFLPGDIRTLSSEWWGTAHWTGFALYCAVAIPTLLWLARASLRRA